MLLEYFLYDEFISSFYKSLCHLTMQGVQRSSTTTVILILYWHIVNGVWRGFTSSSHDTESSNDVTWCAPRSYQVHSRLLLACSPAPSQRQYRYILRLQLGCLRLKVLHEVSEEAHESLRGRCCERTWPQHLAKPTVASLFLSHSWKTELQTVKVTSAQSFNLKHPLQQEESR